MTFTQPKMKNPLVDLALQVGSLVAFTVYALYRALVGIVRLRISLEELHAQSRFIARVCSTPALLLTLPVGVLVAVSVGELATKLGADGYAGAVVGFVIVGQAAALVCALMLAGVGGSAICADLGARKIREEVDAIEVMGIDVVDRLVVPRVIAAALVGIAMCALVTAVGVGATLAYHVLVKEGSSGAFLSTFAAYSRTGDFVVALVKSAVFGITSALIASYKGLYAHGGAGGVAEAVNETVVMAFIVAFVVNTVLSQVYLAVVPKVGAYI